MRKNNKWVTWLLLFSMLFTVFFTNGINVFAAGVDASPNGYVTVSVEKFTLGQGYYREPVKVPFYAGENGAMVLTRVLGEDNFEYGGRIKDGFYLSSVQDSTYGIDVPQYILDKIHLDGLELGAKADEEWLGAFDYTSKSGWMYEVNNVFPNVGFSQYEPHDGDVIRTQFTLYGYGADLGGSYGYIQTANKDALTARVAEINSDPLKNEILSNPAIKSAYDQAYVVLKDMESSQESVDTSLTNMNASLKPDVTVSGLKDKQEVFQSQISITVRAKDYKAGIITPEVKLNGTTIPVTNGKYNLTFNIGENTVAIKATDVSGNSVDLAYTITYTPAPINTNTPKEQLNKNLSYVLKTVTNPKFGTLGGEWSILSLARANYQVPEGYFSYYYNNVVDEVKRLMTLNNGVLDKSRSTEHSRVILALASIGKNPKSVGDYDLTQALSDYDYVANKQGINGPVFALLALDTRNYAIPAAATGKIQTTREKLINNILSLEANKGTSGAGGWALGGGPKPDVDITSMTIQSLAPYYQTQDSVKGAVDRAVNWLSQAQNNEGSYSAWGSTSSESLSQVVTALSLIGIDSNTDARFIKNGHSAMEALLSFSFVDGGVMHVKPSDGSLGKIDGMATDQATYALVAYDRFVNGSNRLYDMTDVTKETPDAPDDIEVPIPGGDQPKIVIPSDYNNYYLNIPSDASTKEISIEIPSNTLSKIQLNLPAGSGLPSIHAVKGDVSLLIAKGTKVTDGDASAIELMTAMDAANAELKKKIASIVPTEKKLDQIDQAVTIGGAAKIAFDQHLTLTFAGMKGKDAAFIQNGVPSAIDKYSSESEGKKSGKDVFAYDNGNNLIVKTKHFTDFVAYATSTEKPGDGGTTPQPTKQVTLLVDKLTIKKGYVIQQSKVVMQPGDTAWSVLQRELDSRGISYSARWTDKFNSIYVESIAGDGEFDHGSGSGWMYNVNGKYPNYGASLYVLKDGDKLQWRYTTDLGKDLGVDNSDWEIPGGTKPNVPPPAGSVTPTLDATNKNPVITVPADGKQDYILNLTKEMRNLDKVTINIPKVSPKVILNLANVSDNLPEVTAVKGDTTLTIDKGTALKSGDPLVEVLTPVNTSDADVQKLVQATLSSESRKQAKLIHAFAMGNAKASVQFDRTLTLVLKGAKGQFVGYIEGNAFKPITIYESESKGIEAAKGKDQITYAFIKDNDVVIRTNHFTQFVSYTVDTLNTEQPLSLEQLYSDAKSISAWAVDAIREASQHQFVSGSEGQFKPQATVTRAEFAKMLVGVLGLDTTSNKGSAFKDVKKTDWFYPYVNAAYEAGFIKGDADQFRPNDKLTREQMAVILYKALGLQAAEHTAALQDLDKVSSWAKAEVQAVIARGVMTGANNRFEPTGQVTREMAAVVAMRSYQYKKDNTVTPQPKPEQDASQLSKDEVKQQISKTAAFMQKTVTDPVIGTLGGDWTIFGLARSGISVPDAYYAKYYANVEKILNEKSGKLHAVKFTEYDRVILALTSIGKNVDQVAGYNLREWLADYNTLIKQGINGPIFALIALDSKSYDIPDVQSVKTQTTREMLIDFILKREIAGGGWALGEKVTTPDPDITSMAIQGLTPYYATNKEVKAAVDRAIAWLSQAQTADGGYASWESSNSESSAQVIVALTGLGINPHTDVRFVKNGKSVVDALMSFAAESGGFYHVKPGGVDNGGAKPGEVDPMATDQAMYALVAYDRLLNGKTRLYDMSDVQKK
ncbi:S-layer homology domain-containing protein [Paenibacillus terrigena]|uniref:S-layer homology domain-containing protein n=1 Tax=Paenibacillus terrigena TaxID=369333 RepID=UPI00037ADD10|nr:S-layer homology domain-containing protein [Paenibacillus terrigena]